MHSDGILRVYVLTTPYGEFTVNGDEMMRMRINELKALARLDKVSTSEAFGKALAEAGLSPLKFTADLITNPVGTVQNTFAGIGGFFNRLGSDMNNAGKTQDDALGSLLGVTDQRRQIAAAYGVDPYTDFPPLAAQLDQLARAAATGGLVVKGALMAVPGAAGIIVSNLSTANTVNSLGLEEVARKYTAAQILDINRGLLAKMGIEHALGESFLANRNYTPIDATALVAALDAMRGVQNRELFVARAAAANGRAIAYVMRRMAETSGRRLPPAWRICPLRVARRLPLRRHPRRPRHGAVAGRRPILDARDRDRLQCGVGRAQGRRAQHARRIAHHRNVDARGQARVEGARLGRAGAPAPVSQRPPIKAGCG